MLKTRKVTDVLGMPVYTDEGFYYGDVEETVLSGNKVYGWKVRATKNSMLTRVLSGAKGVTVPHQFVKSIGDIMIIAGHALPSGEEAPEEGEESSQEDF
ncbi:PRC-barrel domain-containing protein [Candidatus Woesearchaeota archaeon]|nr:PRC-barrel domain-containing protein [Candidatus Woesearchaeota archaeon]